MRIPSLLLLILVFPLFVHSADAQTSRPVRLKTGTYIPPTDKKSLPERVTAATIVWIQMKDKVNIGQWISSQRCDIKVADVLDDYTLAIYGDNACLMDMISGQEVTTAFDLPAKYKIGQKVSDAGYDQKIQVRISLYGIYNAAEIEQFSGKMKIVSVHHTRDKTFVVADSDLIRVEALAGNPLVQYIDLNVKEFTPLNFYKRSLEAVQGANVDESMGGLGLNGSGITIGHGDTGGFTHEDMKDRVYEFSVEAQTVHAPHTAGTMIGAGNLQEKHRGMAAEARIVNAASYDIISNAASFYEDYKVRVTNNSYAALEKLIDCNSMGEYNLYSQESDESTVQMNDLLHVWASGNSGALVCGDNMPAYNSVLSGPQCNKNGITVGSIWRREGTPVAEFSCQGPTDDGRIKPEIVAQGTNVTSCGPDNNYFTTAGTSMSAPSITATAALMQEAYKKTHNDRYPAASLIKAIMINTADDLLNEGPDFSVGYGKVNTMKAAREAGFDKHDVNTIKEGEVRTYSFDIPAGEARAVFTLCWTDPSASPLSVKQLINDLDLEVTGPGGHYLPWVLDPSPDNALRPATRGRDSLNNTEQISIINPDAGTYTVAVKGYKLVSEQEYAVCYRSEGRKLQMNGPFGGEKYIPGEFAYFQWECPYNSGDSTKISLSLDDGHTWELLGTKGDSLRTHYLSIPNTRTGTARVMVSTPGFDSDTSGRFTICPFPANFKAQSVCRGQAALSWSPVSEAVSYKIYRKLGPYMTEVAETSDTTFILTGLDPNHYDVVSVAAVLADGGIGRRALASIIQTTGYLCPRENDLEIVKIISPTDGRQYTSSALTGNELVSVLIANKGTKPASDFRVSYSIGNGDITEQFQGALQPGETAEYHFTHQVDLSAPGEYNLISFIDKEMDAPFDSDNMLSKKIRHLANERIQLTEDVNTTFRIDFENAGEGIFRDSMLGAAGITQLDFYSDNDQGKMRTRVLSDIPRSGRQALTADADFKSQVISNEVHLTLNMENYSASDNVKLGFSYLNHNADTSNREGSRVWIRGNENDPWIEIYDLYRNEEEPGAYRAVHGLNVARTLRDNGQDFSASTQIRFVLKVYGPAIAKKGFSGYTIDNIYLLLAKHDVQINKILHPIVNSCGLAGDDIIIAELENTSSGPSDDINVWYTLGGSEYGPYNIGVLEGNEVRQLTIPGVNLAATGPQSLDMWIHAAGDSYNLNDTIKEYQFLNNTLVNDFPYLATFEESPEGWSVSGHQSSWAWGIPDKEHLGEAANGSKAMLTSLGGRYNGYENSMLTSPCFDLTAIDQDASLSFSFWHDLEVKFDSCRVEYSEDGNSWKILGREGEGMHWYNRPLAWDSTYNYWHVAGIRLPVDSMSDRTKVQFRFVLSADENLQYGGIAIDDIHIYRSGTIYSGNETIAGFSPGEGWNDVLDGGSLIASLRIPGDNIPENMEVGVYFNTDNTQRHDEVQYYLDRNFSINYQNMVTGPVMVRLYFTDEEAERMIRAEDDYHKPLTAYQLGVTRIASDTNDGVFGNEENAVYSFKNYRNTALVPFENGYYLEFEAEGPGEYYINTGGEEYRLPLGNKTIRTYTDKGNIKIHITPNPFGSMFGIRAGGLDDAGEYTITMSDLMGKKVYRQNTDASSLAQGLIIVPDLPPGIYMLQVAGQGRFFTERVVKM